MPSGSAAPAEGSEVAIVWPRAESRVFVREAS
jgi:putative spermidine/putrescine transport system ATP-binding protein